MTDINSIINTVICGDCAVVMKNIPDNSIDLVVTSPPYDINTLRTYKGFTFDFESIAKELSRVVKIKGTVCWVVGDAMIKKSKSLTSFKQAIFFKELGFNIHEVLIYEKNSSAFPASRKGKHYSNIYEFIFVMSKDGEPNIVNLLADKKNRWQGYTNFGQHTHRNVEGELVKTGMKPVPEYSVRGNIWKYNTGKGYSAPDDGEIAHKHPAIFPIELASDLILSYSNPGCIVADIMAGSGTTLKACKMLDRNFIGIEISEEYCGIINERLNITDNKKKLFQEEVDKKRLNIQPEQKTLFKL